MSTPPHPMPSSLSSMKSPHSPLTSGMASARHLRSSPATSPLATQEVIADHKPLHSVEQSSARFSAPGTQERRRRLVREVQADTRNRYRPYQPRSIPPALELRFACKSIGDTSSLGLAFEDVVEGKDKFISGLSKFSDSVVQKAYIAKSAFRDSILHRIILCRSNINATASRMEMFTEMLQEANTLEVADDELQWIKQVMGVRDIDEDDLCFHCATYSDELVALTIADTQLNHFSTFLSAHHTDKDTPSGDSEDSEDSATVMEDDVVYRDSK